MKKTPQYIIQARKDARNKYARYKRAYENVDIDRIIEWAFDAGFDASSEGFNGEWWGENGQDGFDEKKQEYLDYIRKFTINYE